MDLHFEIGRRSLPQAAGDADDLDDLFRRRRLQRQGDEQSGGKHGGYDSRHVREVLCATALVWLLSRVRTS